MPVGRFLLYTTIGAGAWNVVLALLGWFIGKTVPPRALRRDDQELQLCYRFWDRSRTRRGRTSLLSPSSP